MAGPGVPQARVLHKEVTPMAAGDAQRVWFAQMKDELKGWWRRDASWEEFTAFCQRMMEMRTAIRTERGIKAPMMYCPVCRERRRSDISGISVRSALFALLDAGAIGPEEFAELDRSWKRHQRSNGLSAYGKPKQAPRASHVAGDCGHATGVACCTRPRQGPADKAHAAIAGLQTCRSS